MIRKSTGVWRSGLLAVALLALFVRAILPSGFMVADTHGAGGFPLVICTGHGPLTLANGKSTPATPHADGTCAFAGHAAGPPPQAMRLPTSARVAFAQAPAKAVAHIAPGLGLAAPPPPSHAPPLDA